MTKITNIIQGLLLMALSFLVTTVLMDTIKDYKFNKEWSERVERRNKYGTSPVTRGGYVSYPVRQDTAYKKDSIK